MNKLIPIILCFCVVNAKAEEKHPENDLTVIERVCNQARNQNDLRDCVTSIYGKLAKYRAQEKCSLTKGNPERCHYAIRHYWEDYK